MFCGIVFGDSSIKLNNILDMDHLKNIYLKNSNLFKIVGIAIIVIIVLFSLGKVLFYPFTNFNGNLSKVGGVSLGYDNYAVQEESYDIDDGSASLSVRNVAISPITPDYIAGNDARILKLQNIMFLLKLEVWILHVNQ